MNKIVLVLIVALVLAVQVAARALPKFCSLVPRGGQLEKDRYIENNYEESRDSEAEEREPAEKPQKDDSKAAKVQFMITNKMRHVLVDDLGYLPSEVDEMEPQIAAVVIERKLGRPSNGMPASWRRPEAATTYNKKALRRIQSTLKNSASRVLGFVRVYVRPVLPLVVAASAVYFQRTSLKHFFAAAYAAVAKATWQRDEKKPSPAKTRADKPKTGLFGLGKGSKSAENSKEKIDMKALNKVYSSSWMEEASNKSRAWWQWRK